MSKISVMTKTTAEDYKTFVFFHMFLKKKIMLYFQIISTAISIAVVAVRLSGAAAVSDWYYYVCLAFLVLILLQYSIYRSSVRKFLASDKVVISSERSVVIDESEITAEGGKENGAGTYRWDMFFCAYETKKYFYLYINTMQAIILPKRDFKAEEIPALETLIREKLGQKFIKR